MSTDDADHPKDETNGAVHDDAPEPDADLEPSPDPRDAPPPEAVAELAAACVRFVATKYKVPLDFEPETLSLLDHYLEEGRKAAREKPETAALVAHAAGA